MVTDSVRSALADPSDYEMRYLGRIAVKGTSAGVGMYEVIDGDSPDRLAAKHATSAEFAAAVSAFVEGAFDDATVRFDAVLAVDGHDEAARYLQSRARELALADVPWDGFDRAAK
jgi:adenylate cyclase